MIRRAHPFRPFATGGRWTVPAILITFAVMAAVTIALSISATERSQHRGTVVQVADRQRTLADRYVEDVLLVQSGMQADPASTGSILARSAHALLDGGTAPAVPGDDDETTLSAATDPVVRAQLEQERRLVNDLTATGAAMLAGRPASAVPLTAHEHIQVADPVERLRVLAGLTSNVSLNAARTIADNTDQNISNLITIQVALGIGGLVVSLLLAWALIATTRRQTAHFRSLVQSSSDLVMVLGGGGCRYASRSMAAMVGRPESELLGDGYEKLVHEDDRPTLEAAQRDGEPRAITFRMLNAQGESRHLDARLTDLRHDRRVRGVVLNARDTTERVALVVQLTTLATQAGARIGTVRAFEKTQLQASTDGLTGLVNRRTLEKQLRGLIKHGHTFALAVADLDHFKALNDAHGHEAGDRALRLFAQVAESVLRDDDVVARWDGEEFVVVLPRLDRYQAVSILDRIRQSLAEAHIGNHPRFTASFGVTDSTEAETLEQLVAIADAGLYTSKQGGRDRVTVGVDEPATDAPAREPAERAGPVPVAGRPRRGNSRPSLHEAADDEDPHPSGREIR